MRVVWIIAALMPAPAVAGGRFAGSHVEAIAGYDRTDVAPGLGAENGVLYGVGAGYDVRLSSIVIGVETELNGSSIRRTSGIVRRSVDRSFYLGGRAGLAVAGPLLIYVKGGYANGRFGGRNVAGYTGNGFRLGGGAEVAIADRYFIKAEYRYSDYGREARGQTAVIGLGLRF
jgi:outer membrane immunogenic protein